MDNASDSNNNSDDSDKKFRFNHYKLSCDLDHKDKLVDSYLPFILKFYNEMMERKKKLRLYSIDGLSPYWKSVIFEHPFTFDALAMDPELKRVVIDDLDRFLKRKELYKKIGRAWKRGYLLYGPPGTGKSSLIGAMANYLKFDIFDLQLSSVRDDSMLRKLLLSTNNKSILIIEDIDCSLGLGSCQRNFDGEGKDGQDNKQINTKDSQISLSGLLNFIDGVWSSCGDERIFVFTTNYKERLDPALLRPGRMDMHLHMSYLTMPGFRILASNYLNISGEHRLFSEIEKLIEAKQVTPAQVAEELLRSDDADIALSSVVQMLKGENNNDNNKLCVPNNKNSEKNQEKKKRSRRRRRVKRMNGKVESDQGNVTTEEDIVNC